LSQLASCHIRPIASWSQASTKSGASAVARSSSDTACAMFSGEFV
jgi:hypothetical protein